MSDIPPALSPHSLLQLMWLASPALPIGGFSYSEGLEAAIEAGLVQDEASAADWLVHQLHLTQTRSDIAVIAKTIPAWRAQDVARVQALNDWVLVTRETSELRLQSEQMGQSLVAWLRNQHPGNAAVDALAQLSGRKPSYPVSFALAASLTQAPLTDCLLSYAFGWAENMVQAAIKAVPLGQSAGQRILARLASEIPAAVQTASLLQDNERAAFSPMLAILSARHEHQYSRIFRS
ncbi:urease accessory protein UreF [Diaphorobacter sp. HDW4A]|uniref:urease accessory protein UreF n=1 Tax=Diaphorobacter sp. HDW4A TaxID=2714924 RepID=UPI00140AA71F|nr:urease accessory protein UreF [Diaphorobacter sp. HDW4A]QIL82483.1 urease accessory protein UreF [Diaphorobacter sp. HDW4A]